jgi:hypothetical protein
LPEQEQSTPPRITAGTAADETMPATPGTLKATPFIEENICSLNFVFSKAAVRVLICLHC